MQPYLTAEVSISAVRHNLALLRERIGPGVALCPVVKADCYGHGLDVLLGAICESADRLAVATPAEALHLRQLGCRRPILAFFSPCAFDDGAERRQFLEGLVDEQITMTVTAGRELPAIAEAARRVGAEADVHLKVDTGMNRSGVPAADAPSLAEQVRRTDGVKLTGVYTHLAGADEADKGPAAEQLARFGAVLEAIPHRSALTVHAANSAATIDIPESHFDMVRPGVSVYGYQPSDQMHTRLPLRPALRLWAPLILVKQVPAGSRVGYGLTCTLDRPSTLGLAPVGYADGYLRCLSNRATVRIRGSDVPILGRVSMDQIAIDLTDVPAPKVGEPVEIISRDPADPHSVEGLARLAGTIPYEVTCRLGRRVRRVAVN